MEKLKETYAAILSKHSRGNHIDLVTSVRQYSSLLEQLHETVSDKNNQELFKEEKKPWKERSEVLKAEVNENLDLERKLKTASEESSMLMRELKIKTDAVQEATVKIELYEKRIETLRKQSDVVDHYESEISKMKDQEKIFNEAIDNLQADYDKLELENVKLKKEYQLLEKKQRKSLHLISIEC